MKFCLNTSFNLPKQSQKSRSVLQDRNLDLSYKTDLDFWDCFLEEKKLFYNRRNMLAHLSHRLRGSYRIGKLSRHLSSSIVIINFVKQLLLRNLLASCNHSSYRASGDKGNISLFKLSRSHTSNQHGHHNHI